MSKGIEVTQTSVSVESAADYQKALDSRWKILEIEDEFYFNYTFPSSAWVTGVNYVKVYSHSKNIYMPFEIQDLGSDYDGLHVPSYFATDDGIYAAIIHAAADASTAINLKLFVRVYNLDIFTNYQAPSSTPSPGSGDDKAPIGVRILSENNIGSRIDDQDMTHFSLNTSAKPFQIHMCGTQYVNNDATHRLILDHFLGYYPTFFVAGTYDQPTNYFGGAYANPGAWANKRTLNSFDDFLGLASSTYTRLTIRGGQGSLNGTYAYLILKDPVVLAK